MVKTVFIETPPTVSQQKGGLLHEFDTDVMEMIRKKAYGGFEGRLEDGELVHFKCWISKKK